MPDRDCLSSRSIPDAEIVISFHYLALRETGDDKGYIIWGLDYATECMDARGVRDTAPSFFMSILLKTAGV